MSDELLKRLETGHDKECAMSYGMHEHCCDCSYPARQEAAARVRELEAVLSGERADYARRTEYINERENVLLKWKERAERAEAERDALRALLRDAGYALPSGLLRDRIDAALAGGTKEGT